MQADMVPQMWPPAAPKSNASTSPFDFRSFTAGAQTTFVAPSSPYQKQAAQVAAAEAELQAVSSMASSLPPDDDTDTALANTSEQDEGTECSVRPITNSLKRLPETVETATAYALMRNGMYPEPLGQVSRCYIVAQTGHDMLLIDQHAAHERLLYLKFSAHGQATPSQPLLLPVSVDIPASAIPYMHRLMPVFENLGLQVEEFGGQTYMVHSIPADLPNLDAANVVADLLDDFETLGKVEQVEILRDRIITRMACRAAVKAGQILHHEEMRALIRDIANARLGFTCPHGRPTMILLTRDQLDKQFKRKV